MYFIAAIILLYIIFMTLLIAFWNKKERIVVKPNAYSLLSVVIPARDEPHLTFLLNDLEQQSLEKSKYEIIVVDDHSLEKFQLFGMGRIIYQKEDKMGKKAALTAGIEDSKGEIIITLDADCRVGKEFLKNIAVEFENYDIVLSPGLIKYSPVTNLFEKLQAMETCAIMGAGVGLHRLGLTALSNGANLAFRKDVWQECNGYKSHEHLASGDDEFFVQQIAARYPGNIKFRTVEGSIVSTTPNKTLSALFHQRLRWAGKWRNHENFRLKSVTMAVFLFHLIICAGLIQLFAEGSWLLITLFTAKFLLESFLIMMLSHRVKQRFYLLPVLILQLIYSPYVVFFGIVSNFLPFNWKGRTYTH